MFGIERPHGDKTLSDVHRMVVYLQNGVSLLNATIETVRFDNL